MTATDTLSSPAPVMTDDDKAPAAPPAAFRPNDPRASRGGKPDRGKPKRDKRDVHGWVVLDKPVSEGQSVRKGEVMYVLSSDRPGDGNQNRIAARVAQVARIEWNRLGPTDKRRIKQNRHHNQQRAQRIEMRERIEREAALSLRGVVAQFVGGVGVHELVDRDGDHEGHENIDDVLG